MSFIPSPHSKIPFLAPLYSTNLFLPHCGGGDMVVALCQKSRICIQICASGKFGKCESRFQIYSLFNWLLCRVVEAGKYKLCPVWLLIPAALHFLCEIPLCDI